MRFSSCASTFGEATEEHVAEADAPRGSRRAPPRGTVRSCPDRGASDEQIDARRGHALAAVSAAAKRRFALPPRGARHEDQRREREPAEHREDRGPSVADEAGQRALRPVGHPRVARVRVRPGRRRARPCRAPRRGTERAFVARRSRGRSRSSQRWSTEVDEERRRRAGRRASRSASGAPTSAGLPASHTSALGERVERRARSRSRRSSGTRAARSDADSDERERVEARRRRRRRPTRSRLARDGRHPSTSGASGRLLGRSRGSVIRTVVPSARRALEGRSTHRGSSDDALDDREPEARAGGAGREEGVLRLVAHGSGFMPPPVSANSRRTGGARRSSWSRASVSVPPSGIACIAFAAMFSMACRRSSGSPSHRPDALDVELHRRPRPGPRAAPARARSPPRRAAITSTDLPLRRDRPGVVEEVADEPVEPVDLLVEDPEQHAAVGWARRWVGACPRRRS